MVALCTFCRKLTFFGTGGNAINIKFLHEDKQNCNWNSNNNTASDKFRKELGRIALSIMHHVVQTIGNCICFGIPRSR